MRIPIGQISEEVESVSAEGDLRTTTAFLLRFADQEPLRIIAQIEADGSVRIPADSPLLPIYGPSILMSAQQMIYNRLQKDSPESIWGTNKGEMQKGGEKE